MKLREYDGTGTLLREVDIADPTPFADDVRLEAQRRIHVLLGARDQEHALIIQTRAHEEAIRILDKRAVGDVLTPEEEATAARFRVIQVALAAIRAASNAMEADPPTNFADDHWWP